MTPAPQRERACQRRSDLSWQAACDPARLRFARTCRVIAVEGRTVPRAAVPLHPESIMTLGDDVGPLLTNDLRLLAGR